MPRAAWRSWTVTRFGRFLLMEGIVGPLWRSLVDLDAAGEERLAALEPPFIVAPNHVSEFDPGAVLYGVPYGIRRRLATTAMWEYFEDARTGPLLYRIAVFGLDLVPLVQKGDWRPTLEIAGRVADRGGCPVVFPEGERSTDGGLLRFREGVGVMARDLHLPIVPCAIAGLLAVLPKGAHWPRACWTSRAKVAVRFGDPLPAPRPGESVEETVAELKRRVANLHDHAVSVAGGF
ncbi:MAG: lysophospholipid acyltransferase family protein [Gemmatimonadota bacterium]|nr:lysophospholipid acyltransferase family protein [Gemmatimonadota bacterium]